MVEDNWCYYNDSLWDFKKESSLFEISNIMFIVISDLSDYIKIIMILYIHNLAGKEESLFRIGVILQVSITGSLSHLTGAILMAMWMLCDSFFFI